MENQATRGDPDGRFPGAITPGMPVTMKLRTQILLIAAVVSIVLGGAGGYYALASTDKTIEARTRLLEVRSDLHDGRLSDTPTKADLRELRSAIKLDVLNMEWECSHKVRGVQTCSPRMRRGYGEDDR